MSPPGTGRCRRAGSPWLPDGRDGALAAVLAHLVVDAVRGAAQRELAQRDQVALAEEILDGALGLLRQVDLALAQALQQLVGRQVDQHHFVGLVEHVVGHRLPDADAGDAADHVVQAFDVLDVDGRIDVDAGVEQLVDVLPAFRVARAGRVGVREFVDQEQRRAARERGVEIEFAQRAAAVLDFPAAAALRGPRSSAAVSLRPWVSTTPTTTSVPERACRCAAASMA